MKPLTTVLGLLLVPLAHGQIQMETNRHLCNIKWDLGMTGVFIPPPAFSDDETMVATILWRRGAFSYHDGRLVVPEVPTCNVVKDIYLAREVPVTSTAFSPDSRDVAVGRKNHTSVYDLHSPSDQLSIDIRHKTHSGFAGYVGQYVQFSADGTKLFLKGIGGMREKMFTFPVDDWRNYTEFEAGSLGVYPGIIYRASSFPPPITYSPDRGHNVVAYEGGSFTNDPPGYNEIHVYNLEAGERVCATDQSYDLYSAGWSPDGSTILTTGKDAWPTYDYSNITSIDPHACEAREIWGWQPEGTSPGVVIYLDNDHILLSEGKIARLRAFNLQNRTEVESFTLRENTTKLGLENRVSSRFGGYFAGTRTGNTPSVFMLFRWSPGARVAVEELSELPDLQVNPNRAADQIRFTQDGRVKVLDFLGRQVMDTNANSQRYVAVEHLPAGMYLNQFSSESGNASGKLLIQ